jgi:hypothetical protein
VEEVPVRHPFGLQGGETIRVATSRLLLLHLKPVGLTLHCRAP